MKYWQSRKLSSKKFKRLYGVKPQTFRVMVRLVKTQEKQKKKLLDFSLGNNLIAMDVMESSIERPKKHQKRFYSGKQGEHTLKTQVVIEQKTLKIIFLGHDKGKMYDFMLFKTSRFKFSEPARSWWFFPMSDWR